MFAFDDNRVYYIKKLLNNNFIEENHKYSILQLFAKMFRYNNYINPTIFSDNELYKLKQLVEESPLLQMNFNIRNNDNLVYYPISYTKEDYLIIINKIISDKKSISDGKKSTDFLSIINSELLSSEFLNF
jgi:hypothetical protein